VIVVTLIIVSAISNALPTETITVEGVSSVFATPNLVKVYFNIETTDDDAAVAKDANAEIVKDVKTALILMGIDRDDIATQNFNIYEDFDWRSEERVSLGYKATHSIVVSLESDNEAMIGGAIDAAVDNGALLGHINFELSQELENEYKASAMKLAAEDAKVKGEAVASGLGSRLGKVVSTSANDFGYRPWLAYAEDSVSGASLKGAEIATNIQVGDQEISSRISVTYKIR